jgi:hypothetical protein
MLTLFHTVRQGQISQGLAILAPYLPQEGVSGSAYSEGGALFALGLIHTNHGAGVIEYLTNALKNTQTEVIQHGACLGLGVAGMGSHNDGQHRLLFYSHALPMTMWFDLASHQGTGQTRHSL